MNMKSKALPTASEHERLPAFKKRSVQALKPADWPGHLSGWDFC